MLLCHCTYRQESETREKQEKIAEHKRLTADRAKIEADIAKVSEQLAACLSYKQFLDRLVPDEWKQEQAKLVRHGRAGIRVWHAGIRVWHADHMEMTFVSNRYFAEIRSKSISCQSPKSRREQRRQRDRSYTCTLIGRVCI